MKVPLRMKHLPCVDELPVPWYVSWIKMNPSSERVPDYTQPDPEKLLGAARFRLCWLCGEKVGNFVAFVADPAWAVKKVSPHPPAHRDCAEFFVNSYPIKNVVALWITKSYGVQVFKDGLMFTMGKPIEVTWFISQRKAKRHEVEQSIEAVMPELRQKKSKLVVVDDELNAQLIAVEQYFPLQRLRNGLDLSS